MELRTTAPVDIALRTLTDRERRRVHAWFDHLRNWDNDAHVRRISHKLPNKNVYVLTATDGIRIFFDKESGNIRVLDIAKKETIDQFADAE